MRLHLKDVEAKMKKTLMLQLIRLPKVSTTGLCLAHRCQQIKSMTIEEFQGVYGGDMDAIVEAQVSTNSV